MANWFTNLFRRKTKDGIVAAASPISLSTWQYTEYGGDILETDIIRACVDALSRTAAKMELQAVKYNTADGTKERVLNSDVARVLAKPNSVMTSYDFVYRCYALMLYNGTCFIWPERDDTGKLVALWPINYRSFRMYEYHDRMYGRFTLKYTREYYVPMDELIILRNHYMRDDLVGDPNTALQSACELLNAQNQGIIYGIKNSAMIRGILKALNVVKEEDLEKAKKKFVADNLAVENSGGVIAIDGKYDYQSIESKWYSVDADTMAQAKAKIFDYFQVSEDFLQGKADAYNGIYETRIEPFAIQLTQALTYGVFTDREIGFGNSVEANMSKVKYQSIDAVTKMIQATNQLGLFTRNEYREMLGYGALTDEQGGNEIMIAVNNYAAQDDAQGDSSQGGTEDEDGQA